MREGPLRARARWDALAELGLGEVTGDSEIWKAYFEDIIGDPKKSLFPTFYQIFCLKTEFEALKAFFVEKDLHILKAIISFYLEEDPGQVFDSILQQLVLDIKLLDGKKMSGAKQTARHSGSCASA